MKVYRPSLLTGPKLKFSTLGFSLRIANLSTPLNAPRALLLGNGHRLFSSSGLVMQENKDWSATQYLKFEAERTRPVRDLLAQVPLKSPKNIKDLGCGPGNSTEVLVKHFPDAYVSGMDSSPDMIEKARKRLPNIEFSLGDVTSSDQTEPTDLLFSNAVYQWIPYDQRLAVLTKLVGGQKSGGVFAFQAPDNFAEPTHVAMRETADQAPWAEKLKNATIFRKAFHSPQELYNAFKPLCSEINVWHTQYYHILKNHQAVVEWVKGTGLQPYLNLLSAAEQEEFLKQYLKRIEKAYTPLDDGSICLRYPRLFLVATRA
jgi:trans-aconitate 2-methyltransferase